MDRRTLTRGVVIAVAALPLAWRFAIQSQEREWTGYFGAWIGAYVAVALLGIGVGLIAMKLRPLLFSDVVDASLPDGLRRANDEQRRSEVVFAAIISAGLLLLLQDLFA